MTTGKTIAFMRWTFVGKVMSLLFNMLSTLVIAFLPRSKPLLISWLQLILEPKKIKSVTIAIFCLSICHKVMGLDAMILVFWMLSFKPAFHFPLSPWIRGSLVPLHFLPLEWLSSTYLRLLMFLLAILIPACDSYSPVFRMMYTSSKLNKHGDNIQPCHTPFPILNWSIVPCLVLTVASWPSGAR